MKQYTPLLLAVICIFPACKKDDSSSGSKTELIASAAWKYDKAMADMNKDGTFETPIPSGYLESCEIDNLITFKKDGTGIIDEGPTKCDAGDPQTTAFTWTFTNNETTINFPSAVFTGLTGDVKLVTLTSAKLQLQKNDVDVGFSSTVNILVDLKH